MQKLLISLFLMFLLLGCKEKEEFVPDPIADFLVNNNDCEAPCTIEFYNHSKNAVSYSWSFGNGTTSVKENDTVHYLDSASYSVSLTVYNSNGVADQKTKIIKTK